MRYILAALFFLCFFCTEVRGQVINEQQARKELEERGISEEEIRQKLLERGINIDNIDPNNPSEALKLEAAMKEVMAELESEKDQQAADPTQPIKENATVTNVEKVEVEIRGPDQDSVPQEPVTEEEVLDLPPSNIFGQEIFRNQSITFYDKTEEIKPPDDYILGVGDELVVSIWGTSQANFKYTIDNKGYIYPRRMDPIYLKGLRYGSVKALVLRRFARYYVFREDQFTVALKTTRVISVDIVGEVFKRGNFKIPASNTAFNALVAAGGPTNAGSVRRIQLKRDGTTKIIDVYKYLFDPNVQRDFYLQENDIIFVPSSEKQVIIQGAIKRAAKYELLDDENLNKLIFYAGGFRNNAFKRIIQVKRFENDQEIIIDVDLAENLKTGKDFPLQAGDVIMINSITEPYQNYITLIGPVERDGQFQITEDATIYEILQKAKLKKEARTDVAFLERTMPDGQITYNKINIDRILQDPNAPDNISVQDRDKLIIWSQSRFVDNTMVTISGAVREPGEFKFDAGEQMRISDIIILGGGLRKDAANIGYIYRDNIAEQKEIQYLRVDLDAIISNPDSPDNIVLGPDDRLDVLSLLPFINQFEISVAGAVKTPGSFKYDETLSLTDALTLAGGLTYTASSSRIEIFRVLVDDEKSTKTTVATLKVDENLQVEGNPNFQLEPFDQIIVRQAPEFELQKNVFIEGEIKYPGPYALIADNEQVSSLVERAGGITNESFPAGATLYREDDNKGYVILKLDDVLKNSSSPFNYILKENDRIVIPKSKDLVTIIGATKASEIYSDNVLNNGKGINVAFIPNWSAGKYVEEYTAGLSKDGRKRLITVEHPNGEIQRTKNYLLFKRYPEVRKGSTITVGKIDAKSKKTGEDGESNQIDWSSVFADTIAQATAILSLILLVQRLD